MSTKWKLDPAHSEIAFKIKHMMISSVSGTFKKFDGEIDTEDETFKNGKVSATVYLSSIFTNHADRDAHLQNADFFNVEKNPVMQFTADSFNGEVNGQLTLNGVTKPVQLEVDFGGITKDMYGNTKAGFSFNGKISRKDFGITWNAALETGGMVLGDDVKISGELQFAKEA